MRVHTRTARTRTRLAVPSLLAVAALATAGSVSAGQAQPGTPSGPAAPATHAVDSGGHEPGTPGVEDAPKSLTGVSPVLPASVQQHSSAKHTWRPGKAVYGTASHDDLTVKGAGGTTIRVNEIYPTLANGRPAPGRFPVLMTMTPYGKGSGGSSKPGSAEKPSAGSVTGGADDYLVQRGYIEVVMDVRGTGDSNGQWGLFDPVQQADAVKVLHWAAHLPHSDGRVGTYGPSYLGINQLLLAGSVGKHSPLKAIFPVVAANDVYRDTSFMGGLLDFEFAETYLGLTGGLNSANPVGDGLSDPQLLAQLASIEADHVQGLASYHATFTEQVLANTAAAYDEKYWQQRAPQNMLKRVVANHIPAYLVGGEFDIFQNGEPLNYAELQNAWAGRSVTAGMTPHQRATGRYQLVDGPWEHINGSSVQLDTLELEWFDTWLKHRDTGMGQTRTPLHYYDLGTGRFTETSTYPFTGTTGTRYYLQDDNRMTTARPRSAGDDTVDWSPSGVPCGRPIDQWVMGGISIPSHAAGITAACADDDAATQTGGDDVTYTTAPFARARTIAGPISATVYASATTTETQWVAEVELVTPTGASYPLTEGALLGSERAVDDRRSWTRNGVLVYPLHPYTRASQHAVVPGKVTRYDVQVFPTLATIPRGDRLRVTLATSDTPHLVPIPTQLAKLVGGVYTIRHSAAHPSSLNVMLGRP